MARSLNKAMLIGNVGADPEVRTLASGSKVANVSLATNRTFTDRSGQKQEKAEWHRLTFWSKLADVVEQYVKKGDRMYVEGRIEYVQTQDESGGTRHYTNIVVDELVMLGSSANGDSPPAPRRATAPASPFDEDDDDDSGLPF